MKKFSKSFDKYLYYTNSVQSADHDAELLLRMYRSNENSKIKTSLVLQEDFCGTGALCYEWVQLHPENYAVGIDLDSSAIKWGAEHHSKTLDAGEVSRVSMIHGDVLENHNLKPDIICALNFSYFFMKDRTQLKTYFQSCKKSLNKNGQFIIDVFGGPDYQQTHIDKRRNANLKFTYWWEIASFDPIQNNIVCHLHFQPDGLKKRTKVFTYEWRLWSIPELVDILRESGFTTTQFWAEGLNKSGRGNGKFRPIAKENDCSTWMTYIVAK